jgi:glycosyltransferase involved in cell wall biosynthesis
VWPLCASENRDPRQAKLSRAALSNLPPHVITPEILSACTVVRREVVREMDVAGHGLKSALGEFRLLLCQARRRGFRNLVVNHVVMTSSLPLARLYPALPPEDEDQLNSMYFDIARANAFCTLLPQPRLEELLARAHADDPGERRRLLLDCRGMIDEHNGTAHHILGLLDGFDDLGGEWQFEVLVSKPAAEFHHLRERHRKFRLIYDHPRDTYSVAVLLNQPWGLSTIAELHRHALLILFNMLDTISWDVLYVCDESLDAVWRFIARYSDGLLFNSQFTCDRFRKRFPPQAAIAERTTHLSLAIEEQVDPLALEEPVGDYILVFGNDYDHKDVRRTLQILADAFPFCKFVAIGIEKVALPNATAMPSGKIEPTALHRLFAGARVIVFPSFYEGFGMPVVQGLAYGRPVIVRRSPLWEEVAAKMRSPGQLVPYDTTPSLVEAVGCALAGLPLNALPQGSGLAPGQAPARWRDCARRIVELIEELLTKADGKRWRERDEALQTVQLLRL